MTRYSQERRETVLKKLLPPYSRSVAEVAKEEGISDNYLETYILILYFPSKNF